MYCAEVYVQYMYLPFLNTLACLSFFFALSLLYICTSFVVGWVPVVSALSVTAVDGGKEQEGLVEREKQRWALASKRDVVSRRF